MLFDAGHGTSGHGTTLRQAQGPVSRLVVSRPLCKQILPIYFPNNLANIGIFVTTTKNETFFA